MLLPQHHTVAGGDGVHVLDSQASGAMLVELMP